MNCTVNRPAAVVLTVIFGVALNPALLFGQKADSPLVPPNSHAFGATFETWNLLQTQYALETVLGGLSSWSDTVGGVRLLPANFDTTPVFNVKLRPGTPFVAAPSFLFGESYDDPSVPADNPGDPNLQEYLKYVFKNTFIQIKLDGRVLLEGSSEDLKAFRFGPVYFVKPINYAAPQSRGPGLNAIAALWVVGVGAVYGPLPPGEHTLVYTVHNVFGPPLTVFTYNIAVSAK